MNVQRSARLPLLGLASLLVLLLAAPASAKDSENGYLGVMLQDVSGSMAKALQLDEGEGVLVSEVVDDSPAARAGLADGDVILKFDGRDISDSRGLTKAVRGKAPSDKVEIEFLRNGKRKTAQVELGKAKTRSIRYSVRSGDDEGDDQVWIEDGDGDHDVMVFGDDGDFGWFGRDRGFMGVEMDNLTEQLGEYFGVKDGEGALISKVRQDSPAARAGLKAGDVIIAVDDEEIEDTGDVHAALAESESGQEVTVKVVRKGKKKSLKVTLGEMPDEEFGSGLMKHFGRDGDFRFPPGFQHDLRIMNPHGEHGIARIYGHAQDDEDLSEVHEELDKLRAELKELRSELKSELKK